MNVASGSNRLRWSDARLTSACGKENLGVAKPFDDEIDARLEDFISAYIYDKQGQ